MHAFWLDSTRSALAGHARAPVIGTLLNDVDPVVWQLAVQESGLRSISLNPGLSPAEMETIQKWYRRQDRDPTDIELETLAEKYGLKVPSRHMSTNPATWEANLADAKLLGQRMVGSGGFAPPGIGRCSSWVRARPAWISRYGASGPLSHSSPRKGWPGGMPFGGWKQSGIGREGGSPSADLVGIPAQGLGRERASSDLEQTVVMSREGVANVGTRAIVAEADMAAMVRDR